MKYGVTKQGYAMSKPLQDKVIAALAERNGATLAEVARRVGISRRTLTDYMTPDILGRAAALEEELRAPSLEHVDRAMLAQACKGNVAAARLVYMRMAQKGHVGRLPTLDEMELELRTLRLRETNANGEQSDGEGFGDDVAVGSGQIG